MPARKVEAGEEPLPPDAEPEEMPQEEEGPRVLVLDLETKRGATDVGGWGNIHLMGLAVAVAWDSHTGQYRSYYEDQAADLLRDMAEADVVVGFNLLGFDYRVLSAYDDGSLDEVNTFDMLQDVRRRLGFRLSLAHLAGETIGSSKSADGLQSLQWVKEGRMDLVEEYCRRDVEVTKDLFYHGLEKGWLRYRDKEKRRMQLAVDWNLRDMSPAAR
jgi:DEAD/DEAH box helicase domain-containing protein